MSALRNLSQLFNTSVGQVKLSAGVDRPAVVNAVVEILAAEEPDGGAIKTGSSATTADGFVTDGPLPPLRL